MAAAVSDASKARRGIGAMLRRSPGVAEGFLALITSAFTEACIVSISFFI